jgi:hypothetical protein
MGDQDDRLVQVWEGDYGAREGFLEAVRHINSEVDKNAITGLTIYWSDLPYSLELYAYVAYDPDHAQTTNARQLVADTMRAGGGRLRTDITSSDFWQAVSQRQLNGIGCVKGFPVPDPCAYATKASLSTDHGYDFSPWNNRTRTFLSHQADRKPEVSMLQMLLADRGVPTWMDTHDIEFGESIASAIERGTSESTFVIFWISQGFLESRWCHFEFESFLHAYASERSVVMIPVVEAGCESRLPSALRRIKYVSVDNPGDPRSVARDLVPLLTKPQPKGHGNPTWT